MTEDGVTLPDDEEAPEDAKVVNNIISTYKLGEVDFNKEEFGTYFKAYLKKMKKHFDKIIEANKGKEIEEPEED